MSTSLHGFMFWGMMKNAAGAWRPRLEPVSVSCQVTFLGRGVWGTLAFSLLRDFVYMAEGLCSVSSAHSG